MSIPVYNGINLAKRYHTLQQSFNTHRPSEANEVPNVGHKFHAILLPSKTQHSIQADLICFVLVDEGGYGSNLWIVGRQRC